MMKSKKYAVPVWKAIDIECQEERLGLGGSPTQVMKIFTPPPRPRGQIFTAAAEESVDSLLKILKDILK